MLEHSGRVKMHKPGKCDKKSRKEDEKRIKLSTFSPAIFFISFFLDLILFILRQIGDRQIEASRLPEGKRQRNDPPLGSPLSSRSPHY